jgi:hypothetical protein
MTAVGGPPNPGLEAFRALLGGGLGGVQGADGSDAGVAASGALSETAQNALQDVLAALGEGLVGGGEFQPGPDGRVRPALPDAVTDLLGPGLGSENAMVIATHLFNEAMDAVSKGTMGQIRMRKEDQAKVNDEQMKALLEAQRKAREAEPGFWGKLFGWVSKVVNAVVGVGAMVLGAMACASGVGALAGVGLMAAGAYLTAGVVMEIVNEVRVAKGLDPIDWNPIGKLAAWVATEVFGADEETAKLVKSIANGVTDLVVGIVAGAAIPGVGLAVMTSKLAKAGQFVNESIELTHKIMQTKAMVSRVRSGVNMVEAGASIGKASTDISLAVSRRDAALAQADFKKVLALLDQMKQMMDMFIASAKDDQEAVAKAMERASDAVQDQAGTQSQIAANLAAPMA